MKAVSSVSMMLPIFAALDPALATTKGPAARVPVPAHLMVTIWPESGESTRYVYWGGSWPRRTRWAAWRAARTTTWGNVTTGYTYRDPQGTLTAIVEPYAGLVYTYDDDGNRTGIDSYRAQTHVSTWGWIGILEERRKAMAVPTDGLEPAQETLGSWTATISHDGSVRLEARHTLALPMRALLFCAAPCLCICMILTGARSVRTVPDATVVAIGLGLMIAALGWAIWQSAFTPSWVISSGMMEYTGSIFGRRRIVRYKDATLTVRPMRAWGVWLGVQGGPVCFDDNQRLKDDAIRIANRLSSWTGWPVEIRTIS